MGRKKRRDKSAALRRVVCFDEESRREFLTGFHKRKVERRKAAVEEIKHKLKEEQKKMKEERHKEYLKMLKEREEALEEADELEHLVTSRTESLHYDHPGHTVTVTTVSDLDLSGARLLGLNNDEVAQSTDSGQFTEGNTGLEGGKGAFNVCGHTLPKKSRDPLLSQRISSLTASLHSRSQKKRKRKQSSAAKNKAQVRRTGRTSKSQRRKMTGRRRPVQD